MNKKFIFAASIFGAFLISGCTTSPNYLLDYVSPEQKPSPNNIQPVNEIKSLPTYIEPSPEKKERFELDFKNVALKTKSDPNYQRIGLNTPEIKKWFKQNTYLLWNRDISKSEYINEGLKKFPENRYEFNFVANNISSIDIHSNTPSSVY